MSEASRIIAEKTKPFTEIWEKLVLGKGVQIRPSRIAEGEPRGFLIVNPANKKQTLHLDIWGNVSHWMRGSNSVKRLHGENATIERRVEIVLQAFQIG